MLRIGLRTFSGVAIVTLAAMTVAVVPAGASKPAGKVAQGVEADSIQMVGIVPDVDTLIARGLAVPGLTTELFMQRWKGHTNAFGPIRGRTIDWVKVGWDPQDSTSFDRACTQAVIDNQPFVVLNSSGFRDSAIPCVTVDNDQPYMTADPMPGTLQGASDKNLISLGLPPEVAAKEAVRMLDRTKTLPKSAKVGIISNNIPGVKAAGDTLEKELKKRGYTVTSKVELNGLASDANLIRNEAATAATTFRSLGVDNVFNVQSFTQVGAFFDEAARQNYKPQMYAIDGQAATCVMAQAGRISPNATDAICITTHDGKAAIDGAGIRPDTEFEAKCRAEYEQIIGFKTAPNAPAGGITVNGIKYNEDFSPWECTILNLLLPAIKKAGKNPTWDQVYANIMASGTSPAAYMSGGEGHFAKDKPFFADKIHMMKLSVVNANTPKDANGTTWAGCPGPYTCWIPITVDGEEWHPIQGSG